MSRWSMLLWVLHWDPVHADQAPTTVPRGKRQENGKGDERTTGTPPSDTWDTPRSLAVYESTLRMIVGTSSLGRLHVLLPVTGRFLTGLLDHIHTSILCSSPISCRLVRRKRSVCPGPNSMLVEGELPTWFSLDATSHPEPLGILSENRVKLSASPTSCGASGPVTTAKCTGSSGVGCGGGISSSTGCGSGSGSYGLCSRSTTSAACLSVAKGPCEQHCANIVTVSW